MRIDKLLKEDLDTFKPDIVGITALTPDVYAACEIFENIKKFNKDVITVVGGHHPTLIPEDFNKACIDFVVIGEGQATFSEIVDAVEFKKDFSKIKGIGIQENCKLKITQERDFMENLDDMPFPVRHLTKKYREKYFRAAWRPVASLLTSRGCPFRCNFCAVWKHERGRYRLRSAESIVKEIQTIEEPYISICDDNFLHDVNRAEKLYELLKEKGIKKTYKLIARSDTIVKHPDLIAKWKEIGAEMVLLGIESFRDEELKVFNKSNSVKNNEEAINILHQNNITVVAQFIVNPDYLEKDFIELGDYVEKMNLPHPIFSVLTPLPGTDLYHERYKEFVTYNYNLFDFIHSIFPTKLPREKFYECLADLYLRTYTKGSAGKSVPVSKPIYEQLYMSIKEAYKY